MGKNDTELKIIALDDGEVIYEVGGVALTCDEISALIGTKVASGEVEMTRTTAKVVEGGRGDDDEMARRLA
tara:strand:+ start:3375 stop:3587 length:213 start_codon:yes stop_codon:yes gene_type:complete